MWLLSPIIVYKKSNSRWDSKSGATEWGRKDDRHEPGEEVAGWAGHVRACTMWNEGRFRMANVRFVYPSVLLYIIFGNCGSDACLGCYE